MLAYQLACLLLLSACHGAPSAQPLVGPHTQASFTTRQGPVTFDLEVADTEHSREQGLMYRKSVPQGSGMVFVFPTASSHTFWMKNTYIPLDMVFVNAAHAVIGIVPSAEPLTLAGRGVPGDSKFVIEFNGGTCARLGIVPGSTVTFTGLNESPKD